MPTEKQHFREGEVWNRQWMWKSLVFKLDSAVLLLCAKTPHVDSGSGWNHLEFPRVELSRGRGRKWLDSVK